MAQRAVTSYVRSVFLQPNRTVFDVSALPLAEYTAAMGLLAAPKLRFLKREGGAAADAAVESDEQPTAAAAAASAAVAGSAGGKLAAQPDASPGSSLPPGAGIAGLDGSGSDDDFLVLRRQEGQEAAAEPQPEAAEAAEPDAQQRKRKKQRLRIKAGAAAAANRVVFDEDGRPRQPLELLAGELDRCKLLYAGWMCANELICAKPSQRERPQMRGAGVCIMQTPAVLGLNMH